jgi:hypothetical protein
VRARFVGRGLSRGATSASTCKTFFSRVIHKTFSVDDLLGDLDKGFIFLALAT